LETNFLLKGAAASGSFLFIKAGAKAEEKAKTKEINRETINDNKIKKIETLTISKTYDRCSAISFHRISTMSIGTPKGVPFFISSFGCLI
jgi:hypothetical protein